MSKKYSRKFWITFWVISTIFLAGWFMFWQFMNNRKAAINTAIKILPISEEEKNNLQAVNYFADYVLKKDGTEKTFLILFQNNMELRPGGGYIGSFGILKTKDGQVTDLQTHDVVNFDGRIPDTEEPPYPMPETLKVHSWKLRDSNFSPDFVVNAQKADYFYHLGQGQDNFDGIIAINADVLTSFLKVTGPVSIDGFPGTYDSENAIMTLEYQVEKGYRDQGLTHAERKSIMSSLSSEIMKRVFSLNETDKLKLARIILEDLNNKDIQLYFKDSGMEAEAEKVHWDGQVNQNWPADYLMIVDANLGAYKSDYYMRRSFEYTVDLSGDQPKANLKVTYVHTAKEKDWMTKEYISYLRIYTPDEVWFGDSTVNNPRFGTELGHKFEAALINVPLDQTKTFEFNYTLPQKIKDKPYNLLIQKQSGVGTVPGKVTIIKADGSREVHDINLENSWTLN